jgi:Bacteriophage HK97-gp10, putative tail-component
VARPRQSREVVLEWDATQVAEWLGDPNGDLARQLMERLGEVVTAGAKRRALKRTGRMASEIHYVIGSDGQGIYADIISPVFYARFHEGQHVRDRRPHRSLRPALRDIRHILSD